MSVVEGFSYERIGRLIPVHQLSQLAYRAHVREPLLKPIKTWHDESIIVAVKGENAIDYPERWRSRPCSVGGWRKIWEVAFERDAEPFGILHCSKVDGAA